MVVMIINTIYNFLFYSFFAFIHSLMVFSPLFSKYVSFFFDLAFQIVTQHFQLILELLLELINNIMNMIHTCNCMFFVFLNLCIGVIEFLFHLSFIFDTSILEHFKSSTHIFHLRLQVRQVFIFTLLFFNHFWGLYFKIILLFYI